MLKYGMLCGSIGFLLLVGAAHTDPPKGAERPRPVLTLQAHGQVATCVCFSPCGTRLATGGLDQRAAIWDATTGKKLLILKDHSQALLASLSFSLDGKRLTGWDHSPAVKVWDAKTGNALLTLPMLRRPLFAQVAFSPDGHTLGTLGLSGTKDQPGVLVWDARTGKRVAALRDDDPPVSFAYTADGKRLATGGVYGTVTIWEMATGAAVLIAGRDKEREATSLRGLLSVAFSRDGKRIATAGGRGMVRVWLVPSGKKSWEGQGHKPYAARVTFSPDSKKLASAGFNGPLGPSFRAEGEVVIWNAADGAKERVLRFAKGEAAYGLAWSPDSTRLATAHGDGTVKVWPVKDLLGR
jgi:WD40 repeat protein